MMNQNSSQSNLNLSQNNYNFMSRPQQPLELVPAGQSYTQLTYEPNHKCTVCGHVHSCQDCQRAMLFQQALEPQETKYMDPFILNTAKKMARKYRRTEVDPYSRIKVSRNVGISQDEILERTFKNPTLSITDIVNQINKENEEAREKALMEESDYYNMKTDNRRINNIYITTPATPITPIIPNPPSTIYTPPISSPHFRNISTFGLGLTDPTLGYKKAIIKYAAPRQPAAVKKQLPNPVTPNLKMVSGSTLSEMGIFFKRLWGWY
ncbi:8236_t:CDS:2 [Diversispora eburnea]|uniref:8236_t:CDS:1 n=1 Tax=Diversispora eburnea TaxID=1213867 RepID=A0A9N9AGZ3_9GLOM|nr:8236_t:CDS:2 [Diversispora eburnea]